MSGYSAVRAEVDDCLRAWWRFERMTEQQRRELWAAVAKGEAYPGKRAAELRSVAFLMGGADPPRRKGV